jgi:hypothetical protein
MGYALSGDECRDGTKSAWPTEDVAVLVPEPCIFRRNLRRNKPQGLFPPACREETNLNDFVRYTHRYFVNISSHTQWYRERGVYATAVIIMRDSTISLISKASHCPNQYVAAKQNEHAWELAREAIVRLDPSNEIMLVSYEGLMLLQETYLFDFYRQLGIDSVYVPDFKDGNEKYVVAPTTA